MSRNSYYKELYCCPKCQLTQKHYVWSSDIETATHPCENKECDSVLTADNITELDTTPVPMIIGQKMTKDQIKAERTVRRKTHFEKDVMPYLDKSEQRGFQRKGYRNR